MIKLNSLENVFLTSDHHFSHSNILRFTKRPYAFISDMDSDYVKKWNSVTDDESIIFHLGDFTLHGFDVADHYFSQLNGKIYILALHWHHDKRWLKNTTIGRTILNKKVTLLPPIEILELPLKNEKGFPRLITMSHYPLREWEGSFHGQFHAHGHIHSKPENINQKGSMDVGVDKWLGELVPLQTLVDCFLGGWENYPLSWWFEEETVS